MKMFNIFKKSTVEIEEVGNNGMDRFDGSIIDLDEEEIESHKTMPSF